MHGPWHPWIYIWRKPFSNVCRQCGIGYSIKKSFQKRILKLSNYFFNELNKIKNDYPKIIKEVRGKGFLIGIQLHFNQSNFIKLLEKNYLLTIRAAENTIRILPPLTVKKKEIDLAIRIIKKVCKSYK